MPRRDEREKIEKEFQLDGWFLVQCMDMIKSERPLSEWPDEVADRFLSALFCGHHVNGRELDKALALHYHVFRDHPKPNTVYVAQNDRIAERIRADLIGGVPFGAGLHLYEDVLMRCRRSLMRHREELVPGRKQDGSRSAFLNQIEKSVASLMAVTPQGEGCWIRLPLLYQSGSTVVVHVEFDGSRFLVSDKAGTLEEARDAGYEDLYQKYAREIAINHGVGWRDCELSLGVNAEKLAGAIMVIANCSKEIMDTIFCHIARH